VLSISCHSPPLTPCKVVQVGRKRIELLTFSDAKFYLQFSNLSTSTQRFYSNSRWNFTVTDYRNINTLPWSLLEVWWRVNSSLEMSSKSSDGLFLQWADDVSQSVVWGPTWEADSCAITAFPWQITNVRLPSLLWHSVQPGQLYSPAALYPQGNSLLLISVRGWVDTTATECGQKEHVTWKRPKDPDGKRTQNLQRCSASRNSATMSPRMGSIHHSKSADPSVKFSPADPR